MARPASERRGESCQPTGPRTCQSPPTRAEPSGGPAGGWATSGGPYAWAPAPILRGSGHGSGGCAGGHRGQEGRRAARSRPGKGCRLGPAPRPRPRGCRRRRRRRRSPSPVDKPQQRQQRQQHQEVRPPPSQLTAPPPAAGARPGSAQPSPAPPRPASPAKGREGPRPRVPQAPAGLASPPRPSRPRALGWGEARPSPRAPRSGQAGPLPRASQAPGHANYVSRRAAVSRPSLHQAAPPHRRPEGLGTAGPGQAGRRTLRLCP
ncbi:translation initiation factor IF-2-like [Eublepharis macularius]|uniref:Translation initiation factor IF-2-like n=1 Tax=Eublepharis macularius TaxID=481883 RepID=A0AA97LCB5_EUBMA|nr:translation initiation factor IF-2-like [Eublepharis macularius]